MRVPPFRGGTLELRRQGFKHGLVTKFKTLGEFFLGHSITGTDQLHDRDGRHCGCGDELDHHLGFADVGFLDIKTRVLSVRKNSSMVQRFR